MHQVEFAEPTIFPVAVKLAPDESEFGFNQSGAMDLAARERGGPEGRRETPGSNHVDLNQ